MSHNYIKITKFMCGFNGIISKNNLPNINFLNRSKKYIYNRGPDAFESCLYNKNKNNFYFNHARLSIIDLNDSSNQPFKRRLHIGIQWRNI